MVTKELYYDRLDYFATRKTTDVGDRTAFKVVDQCDVGISPCTYGSVKQMARGLVDYLRRHNGIDMVVAVPRAFAQAKIGAGDNRPRVEFSLQEVSVLGARGKRDDLYQLGKFIRKEICR